MADEDDVPGWSRSKFPYWITQHDPCETREVVLQSVVQDAHCAARASIVATVAV
ncbi:hypothetical protein ACFV8E_30795 [Streptomyces sp. NPDC059849]|uniref:hypothetical protein n=1 Tax=Streptomyces sp. NPDC059849 TaxID=3346969 RepID=UPI00365BE3A3